MSILIGQKYRGESLEQDYDALVIGGGLGSLGLAATLSRYGKKTLVLERHYTAGGLSHVFKRKGFEWDVGVHYVGDVHRLESPLRTLFDYVTAGKLSWNYLGEMYDEIWLGEKQVCLRAGVEGFCRGIEAAFPGGGDIAKKYLEIAEQACASSDAFFVDKVSPPDAAGEATYSTRMAEYFCYAKLSAETALRELTEDKDLIAALTGQWGNFGLPPKHASFVMQAMCSRHYLEGGNYPVGGAAEMARGMTAVIEAAGGKVYSNAEVSEILLRDGVARGVRLFDGAELFAPTVVSGVGIGTTLKRLLPVNVPELSELNQAYHSIGASYAHLCLYVGFNESAENFELGTHNIWKYPSADHDENLEKFYQDSQQAFPMLFVSFPSAKDPTWAARYPSRSTATVMTFAPYSWFERWEDAAWRKRGEDYEEFKNYFANRLLAELYQLKPQLQGKVAYCELSTPLSTKHFTNYSQGEIYGLAHSPERFQNYWLRPTTGIENLFLTGQDISTNGVGGALYGGLLCASAILQRNCVGEILSAAAP
jgi:all-trans-retinol 13,14-reductase